MPFCYFFHKQAQVEKHVIQNVQLSELLNLAHEKPIMLRDENFYIQQQSSDITHEVNDKSPKFVGLPCHTNMLTGKGMPKHITNAESAVLLRVIKANTTFVLSEPVQAGKSLAVTLTDRQQLQHDDERYVRVILRALPSFHNKSGHDNVKVAVEYDSGPKLHFAKCVVFLKDNQEEYFVILQWYDQVGRQPFDSVSGLVQLVLRPPNVTKSYSIMPITCIVNGAIITSSENKLWVLLSPRETSAYELTNMS